MKNARDTTLGGIKQSEGSEIPKCLECGEPLKRDWRTWRRYCSKPKQCKTKAYWRRKFEKNIPNALKESNKVMNRGKK